MGALDQKIAVISGASSGSGLGIARRFAAEGAEVVLLARGAERLRALADEIGPAAIGIPTDVSDPDSVRDAFAQISERHGRLDILINNAAIYRPCAVEKISDEDIARQIGTNFAGPVYTCRAAIPLLRAAGGGDIINTSSESTIFPYPMLSMYVSTKAALEMFGRVLAHEVRADDIRVTTVVQGTTAPPDGAETMPEGAGTADFKWEEENAGEAYKLWTEMGLLNQSIGRYGGQAPEAVGDVHLFIVTRPRSQKLDVVYCRSM
jgi:NAD(P)-dependent dehydrogenase (short-subunit alcohol dehydrogenase family)